jgi:hypothetical protein
MASTYSFDKKEYKTLGTDYGSCREVNLDEAVKVYGESLRLVVAMSVATNSGRVVLARTHAKCQGKWVELELRLLLMRFSSDKVCVEVLEDIIVPETEGFTKGMDFRQRDRFNIIGC